MVFINFTELSTKVSDLIINLSLNEIIVFLFIIFILSFTIYQWIKNLSTAKNIQNELMNIKNELDKK